MKRPFLLISVLLLFISPLRAQISGIINSYTPVLGFNCDSTKLQVPGATGFAAGDLVMIIQMQGVTINQTNTIAFGDIENIGQVGNYEFNRIASITPGQINLQFRLLNRYDIGGKVQLVRVPEYTNVTTGNLTCKAWDGTTGGVLAIDVSGTLTVAGDMDVSEKGFRGGQPVDANVSIYHETQFVYPPDPKLAAAKGEGVAILQSNFSFGRGKSANGGGGGNAHNAGGAGGGNAGVGGNGGLEYFNTPDNPTLNTDGIGGLSLFPVDGKKAIMGGGGGAGHANDEVSEAGGNGGGIIYVRAQMMQGTNHKFLANGGSVFSPGTGRNDGQGGGGAGGTILLNVSGFNGMLSADAKGGNGGDCLFFVASQIIGPGGGGGGGKFASKTVLFNLVMNVSGGINGIANQGLSNGASPGETGKVNDISEFGPYSNIPVVSQEAISFCEGDSITLDGEIYTESGTVSITYQNSIGCDSLVVYTLSVLPQPTRFETISFCPGDVITIGGITYTQSGTVIDTLPGNTGCDTIVTYTLVQLPNPTRAKTIEFCPGDVITIGGINYTQSGTVIDTLPGSSGCDTIVTYTLVQLPNPTRAETIEFCPGDVITIGGVDYSQSGTVIDTLPGNTGCDTIVTYTLVQLPNPTRAETIEFCPGDVITIGGVNYTQSGTVIDTLPGNTGCDTIVTYTLIQLPNPTRSETIEFCPGEVVAIGGVDYSQSGTVIDTLPGNTGCDTIVTYTLIQLPNPTRAETIEFCPGESIVLGGQTYTQPGTVTLVHPANTGCDTIVTYTLRSLLPAPSVVDIDCPAQISVIAQPGEAPLQIQYNVPVATSDCPCPGVALTLTSGLPTGGLFPNGTTQVCYTAKDSCGNSASCCFVVTVREIQPCDVKVNGCMRYELLSITADVAQNKTYRIRVINNCPNELIYTAIQLPDQVVAMEPAHLSVYTADSGREYDVRNPNFSPFYSIRYKSTSDSISNGQSDIFQYTLPAQSAPLYMNITSRLFPQLFYEAHLNTFYCPIGVTPTGNRDEDMASEEAEAGLRLYPNPTEGLLWVERTGAMAGGDVWRLYNSQGQQVMTASIPTDATAWRIDLPAALPAGLYYLQVGDGAQQALRFVLQR